jgi:hypothetical protein
VDGGAGAGLSRPAQAQAQASSASPSTTSEVDGGATRRGMVAQERKTVDRDGEKGAEDRRRLAKRVWEGTEPERKGAQGAMGPKLHLEYSGADGKAHQPAVLFRGWARIFCAVHSWTKRPSTDAR